MATPLPFSALHDIRDVIEPSAGAARRVAGDDRGGVHTMWNSDEYRNVWWCVPLDGLGHGGVQDKASIGTAHELLTKLKRHSDPVLRYYGWTVKHLKEHVGGPGGMCYHDNQGTADISLQLRASPSKQCNVFRPFGRLMGACAHASHLPHPCVLSFLAHPHTCSLSSVCVSLSSAVMLHEMCHISGLGLEDIHPPEFYEKLAEVRGVYNRLLAEGAMDDAEHEPAVAAAGASAAGGGASGSAAASTDDSVEGGCRARKRAGARGSRKRAGGPGATGGIGSSAMGASSTGKRRARGPKRSLIDRRFREGKRMAEGQAARTPAENARLAALARFGQAPLTEAERAVKLLRSMGGTGDHAIELSSDDDDHSGVDPTRSMFAPMEALDADDDDGESSDESDVEIHNGPPGMCNCMLCA